MVTPAKPERPDLSNGQLRLAAEAALAIMARESVPPAVRARMYGTLQVLAGVD